MRAAERGFPDGTGAGSSGPYRRGPQARRDCRQLGVSAGTVKTHLENIYRKLEANGKTAAIRKAEKLKNSLIDSCKIRRLADTKRKKQSSILF
jgi:hypothetical protein